jgi:hypothetical protein
MHSPPPDGALAIDPPSFPARRLSYAALMVAAGLTGVYAETIPNFEVLTLVVFCSGVLLGARGGALVGAITMLIFSLLNPYGPAHPLVTLAQVVGMLPAGIAGGLFAAARLHDRSRWLRAFVLGALAVGLTAFFDLVTNVATALIYGQMRVWLLQGIPFALWHIGTNVALFMLIGTRLVGVFAHYRSRLDSPR